MFPGTGRQEGKAWVRSMDETLPPEENVRKLNILLVDDQPEGLLALEAILGDLGQNLVKAHSGKEALREVLAREFAVILLDVQMPEMDGYETAALIRERPASRHTPIIFITGAYKSNLHQMKGYDAGAVDYLLKPIDPHILKSKVAVFVELAQQSALVLKQAAARRQRETEVREAQALELALTHTALAEVARKNRDIDALNQELEAFSYSVSHDLRAPLRGVDGFSRILLEDYGPKLDDEGRRVVQVIRDGTQKMGRLIDHLLTYAHLGRVALTANLIDMTALAREVFTELTPDGAKGEWVLKAMPPALGDPSLVHQVWVNLLANAIKFAAKNEHPRIEAGGQAEGAEHCYYVKDNGAGFDMRYADKLFGVFQRLHTEAEFPGTGAGLSIVKRIVSRHGGRVWPGGGGRKTEPRRDVLLRVA